MRQHDAPVCLQRKGVAPQVLALPAWLTSLSVKRRVKRGIREVSDHTDFNTSLRLSLTGYLPCAYLTIKQ